MGESPRTAILAAGMHRSGTSALTRVISLVGADIASDLMPPFENNNPTGFWEAKEFVDLSDTLLAALNADWQALRSLPENWQQTPAAAEFRARAAAFVAREFGSSKLFVLKDPRICRILPALTAAIESLGIIVKVVVPYRNPAEVAASLYRRDQLRPEEGLQLWLRYVLDAEKMSRGHARSFISYADLLADWKATIKKLRKDLRIRSRLSVRGRNSAVSAFLAAGQRHHDFPDDLAHVHPWIAGAYKAVKRLDRAAHDKAGSARLHRIAAELGWGENLLLRIGENETLPSVSFRRISGKSSRHTPHKHSASSPCEDAAAPAADESVDLADGGQNRAVIPVRMAPDSSACVDHAGAKFAPQVTPSGPAAAAARR
jgi:hypothetical protein